MKLQTNKAGYFTISAHNLALMLEAFPVIADDLFIAKFNDTGRTSVSFRREISLDAVAELASAFQAIGWAMPGRQDRAHQALQNAVFALYRDSKLPVCECDYFDGEPKMAREWECRSVIWFYPNVQAPVIVNAIPDAQDTHDDSNTDIDNYLQEKQA